MSAVAAADKSDPDHAHHHQDLTDIAKANHPVRDMTITDQAEMTIENDALNSTRHHHQEVRGHASLDQQNAKDQTLIKI